MRKPIQIFYAFLLIINISNAQNTVSKDIAEVVIFGNRAQTLENLTNIHLITRE